jgi:hypothetical protein
MWYNILIDVFECNRFGLSITALKEAVRIKGEPLQTQGEVEKYFLLGDGGELLDNGFAAPILLENGKIFHIVNYA